MHGPLKDILIYIDIDKRIQVSQLCGGGPSKAVSCYINVLQAFKVTQLSWYGYNYHLYQICRMYIFNEGVGRTKVKTSVTYRSHMDEYLSLYASNLQHNNLRITYSCKIFDFLKLSRYFNSVGMPS